MANQVSADPSDLASKQSSSIVQRYFEISLLLMLGTSFITLATTGKLDLVSTTVVSAALLVRLWSHLREADYTLREPTVTHLAIFYMFFYALDFLIFSTGPGLTDRMLAATVHLVLFVTVIKIFSARTYRDYAYLVSLSFLMMLAGAILTVSMAYLASLALYVLLSISTLISYEIKRATETARIVGSRESGLGSREETRLETGNPQLRPRGLRAVEKALMKVTVAVALGIVVVASILFFLIPRYRTGYLTGLGVQAENVTGFSENVNLGDIRKIKRSNIVVMRVRVESSPRQFQGLKWRGVGLSSFDGQNWFNDNTDRIPVLPASGERFVLPPPEGWLNRPRHPLRYRVLLSSISTDVLFAAAVPREVSGRLHLISLDETRSLHNPQHEYAAGAVIYEMVSDTGLPSPAELRRASAEYLPEIRLLYLRLPQLDPRVAALARQVTAPATNNYDRALAIQNYLRDNFGYTLDPPGIEPADPIGSFLFKSKQGYCEYFATAMALMLRTMDIPSRLVNGFQTGSYNRVGKDFVVRARDAHTWVEVYFPQYGWIPFDPTPADPKADAGGNWGALDNYLDALNVFWNEWIINYDFSHQVQLARELERDSRQFQQEVRNRFERLERRGVRMAYGAEEWLASHKLLALCLMLAILGGLTLADLIAGKQIAQLRFLWLWKFRRRDVTLSEREATLAYQRLLKILQKKGFQKAPSQTPREFAFGVGGSGFGASVLEFTQAYNALRFGQSPVSLARLRQILEEIGRRQVVDGRQ